MKKLITIICGLLVGLLTTTHVFAMGNDNNKEYDMLFNLKISEEEDKTFDKNISYSQEFLDIVRIASNNITKGKKNTEGIRPNGNLKIYGIKNINPLEFLKEYENQQSLKGLISEHYGILKPYVNTKNELLHTLFFVKDETLNYDANKNLKVVDVDKNSGKAAVVKDADIPKKKGINGWSVIGSGTLVMDNDTIEKVSNANNLKSLLKNLGVTNAKDVKLLSGIWYLGPSIYFTQNGEEFVIPLEKHWNGETVPMKVYNVKEVMEKSAPILKDMVAQREEYDKLPIEQRKDGSLQMTNGVKENLTPINLNNYFNGNESKMYSKNNLDINLGYLGIVAGVLLILIGTKVKAKSRT